MPAIQIDGEVFELLKRKAEPFVDKTPNDVLRRLFELDARPSNGPRERRRPKGREGADRNDTQAFVDLILDEEFGDGFRVRSPYRTMYESDTHIVYFHNFNKAGTSNLWYRVKGSALESLKRHDGECFVVFTNPAERFAYLIPLPDLEKRVAEVGWGREDLEVNIDPGLDRWRELDWDLGKYLRRY